MAFDIAALTQAIGGLAQTSGLFDQVIYEEPFQAPAWQGQLTLSVTAGVVTPSGTNSGLASVSYRQEIRARSYTGALQRPTESIEPRIMNSAVLFMGQLAGEFSLGGLVRQIDIFGAYGEQLSTSPGYVVIGDKIFRTADIMIPLIIDDLHPEVA